MSISKELTPQQEIRNWARKMHFAGAVVIDTEATGGAFQDEIFEIAVVRLVDNKVLFDQLFEPRRPVSWHSTKVHNFTSRDLKGYPQFTDFWDELSSYLADVPILAFNSPFDKRLLEQTCKRYSLLPDNFEMQCIMKACSKHLERKTGVSLAAVCEEFGITGGTHRALSDALAAASVVQRLAN